jgi:hypothetical protein
MTLVLVEDIFVHFFVSRYPPFILRHRSIVYLFVAMISFDMDPLCNPFSWDIITIYIHTSWIHSVLDLVVILSTLLSMGMPTGTILSYLISFAGIVLI